MSDIDPILFIRSLSAVQSKVVLVMLVERGGLTIEELEQRTGFERKALYRACEDLAGKAYNAIVKQTGRHGRVIWMPSSMLLPMMGGSYFQIPDVRPGDIYIEENNGKLLPDVHRKDIYHEKTALDVRQTDICAGSIRLIDRLNHDDVKETPPDENFPTLETILRSCNVLRGMKVGKVFDPNILWLAPELSSIPERTPAKLALGWVVKAWTDRANLSNPAGMIISRLKSYSSRSLPANWQERLPDEYLQAIGVAPAAKKEPDQPAEPEPPPNPPAEPEPEPPARPIIFQLYESEIGPITAMTAEFLKDAERMYPAAWISDAFAAAAKANARNWNYISAVLSGWQRNGRDWKPQSKAGAPKGKRSKGMSNEDFDESLARAVAAYKKGDSP